MKKSKRYVKAIKEAYYGLIRLRIMLEECNQYDEAERVEQTYKRLWCECLNDPPPWSGSPYYEHGE